MTFADHFLTDYIYKVFMELGECYWRKEVQENQVRLQKKERQEINKKDNATVLRSQYWRETDDKR